MDKIIQFIQGHDPTKVNTIVTLISIGLTIITIILTVLNWSFKKQIRTKINAFDLVSYSNSFHSIYIKISPIIRTKNSNNGGKNNSKIAELETILRDFNKYENKIEKKDRKMLRKK